MMKMIYGLLKLFAKIQVYSLKIYSLLVSIFLLLVKTRELTSSFFEVFHRYSFLNRFRLKNSQNAFQSSKYTSIPAFTMVMCEDSSPQAQGAVKKASRYESSELGFNLYTMGSKKTDVIYVLWKCLAIVLHAWVLGMVLWAKFPSGFHYAAFKYALCFLTLLLLFRYLKGLNWQQSLARFEIKKIGHNHNGLSCVCFYRQNVNSYSSNSECSSEFKLGEELLITRFLVVIPLKDDSPLCSSYQDKSAHCLSRHNLSRHNLSRHSLLRRNLVLFPGLLEKEKARELRSYLLVMTDS